MGNIKIIFGKTAEFARKYTNEIVNAPAILRTDGKQFESAENEHLLVLLSNVHRKRSCKSLLLRKIKLL